MMKVTVTTVGEAEGLILSDEAKARLNAQKGDELYLSEAPDGALRITPHDPEFERQMALAEQVMQDDHDILQVLAK